MIKSNRYSKISPSTPAPRKSLFTEKFSYTKEAEDIARQADKLLDEFFSKGYSPREVAHILISSVKLLEVKHITKIRRK